MTIGIIYATARWIEPHLPPWLTRLALGSNRPPTYCPRTHNAPSGGGNISTADAEDG